MKKILLRAGAMLALVVPVLILNGCYTDVGAVRGERRPDYNEPPADQPQAAVQDNQDYYTDTSAAQSDNDEPYYNDDYGYGHRQFYFDYYYPPMYYGGFYYNPWYWPVYSSFYYDPFLFGAYYPYYTPGFYYPYRNGYYNYPYGSYYGAYGTRGYTARRTFGDMGTGGRVVGRTYTPAASTTTAPAPGRGDVTRQQPATTGRVNRGTATQAPRNRGAVNRGGTTRSGNRVYMRPPSRGSRGEHGVAPRSSSPPPRSYSPPPSNRGGGGSSAPSRGSGGSGSSSRGGGGGARGGHR